MPFLLKVDLSDTKSQLCQSKTMCDLKSETIHAAVPSTLRLPTTQEIKNVYGHTAASYAMSNKYKASPASRGWL